jgi:hypothetical protein
VGKLQLPLYVNGMYPANGDEHWSFGNLRFDWSESIHLADPCPLVVTPIRLDD